MIPFAKQKMTTYKEKRERTRSRCCSCCGRSDIFCWPCRSCGFSICQNCMYENAWGLSCNGITWTCPDCQQQNGLGNQ